MIDIYTANEKETAVTDLCIAAHQDDIEIMAYGPIADCYEKGSFGGVVMTDGAGSPRSGKFAAYTDEDMKKVRVEEQKNAARAGRYAVLVQCGFSSAEVKNADFRETVETLKELLLRYRPQRVYTHNLFDKHDTHVAAALRVLSALRELAGEYRPEHVIFLEVWRSLDWLPDTEKLLMDTSRYPEVAAAVLRVYESQIAGGKEYEKAALGRRFANATFLESHHTDQATSLSYGLDGTAFVYGGESPAVFAEHYIRLLEQDVRDRLQRLS